MRSAAHPFVGHLYVLVDSSNSSATFQFAKVIKQNNLGTLVGQPTGGNQRGINGGHFSSCIWGRLTKRVVEHVKLWKKVSVACTCPSDSGTEHFLIVGARRRRPRSYAAWVSRK
ncbi:MAG: hypothetical protein H7145_03305 [Akkermansiaceae bacterium]|nr:hypothetical protein [Armatimonadota bacterium]